ncbi:MAG: hypothetical protein ED559_07340 [Phycisphaera sp.]|nr:MAG: hypothetical protein ED559_07340 [Phycisphaera sp.]
MEVMIPYSLIIATAIGFAVLAILHCAASEIGHLHRVVELNRSVNEKRDRYLAQLRARDEIGEVELVTEEDTSVRN